MGKDRFQNETSITISACILPLLVNQKIETEKVDDLQIH